MQSSLSSWRWIWIFCG